MAYSMSGSFETASNNRLNTVFQGPNFAGRSRQGLPVRAIHKTASRNSRPSPPVRPGSVFLPRQCGSIVSHWASVKIKRSIESSFGELESEFAIHGNPESQRALDHVGSKGALAPAPTNAVIDPAASLL